MDHFDHGLHLERALSVLALRLRHEVALHRALRGDSGREGFGGLLLDGDEAERMLAEMAGRLAASGTAEPLAVIANFETGLARDRKSAGSVWGRIAQVFGLPDAALNLILLAAAPAIDPRFGRAYGFLAEDMSRRHLTLAIAQRLLTRHRLSLPDLRALVDPGGVMAIWGLVTPGPDRPLIEAPIRLDEDMLDLLLTGGGDSAQPIAAGGPWLGLPEPATKRALDRIITRPTAEIDAGTLGLRRDAATDWRGQARMAALNGCVPVLVAKGITGAERLALARALGPGQALLTDDPQGWFATGLRADYLTDSGVTAPALLGRDRALGGLAQRITPTLGLDDLVLTARSRSALTDMATAFGQMGVVLQGWGFDRVWGKTAGLCALFKGPSGTGKTTAAGAVAHMLGLPLYRVNLAGLMSKYIGDSEKHFDQLFTAAEGRDLILFFDEADAAFGKRAQVTDAHDRYANLGTAFLLQRLETHAGLTILATNLQENIDDAFLRRFDAVIEFPAPARDERETLWRRLSLTGAPLGALDFAALAEHQLTGAEIRNACLTAAWRASEAGLPITMEGLARAIALELGKKGRPVRRSDFRDLYAAGRGG